MTELINAIHDFAAREKRRVAIGVRNNSPRLLESLHAGSRMGDVVTVGAVIPGYTCAAVSEGDQVVSDKLIGCAVERQVDAIVRGQLDYTVYHNSLRRALSLSRDLMCICLIRDIRGHEWFFAPAVHHDDATVAGRTYLATQAVRICSALKIEPRVAVLAADSERGYMPAVDKSLDEADEIASALRNCGTTAEVYPLRIDEATSKSNIVVPMDGILGNFLHRALGYLGGATLCGCISLTPRLISIDTSRFNDNFAIPIEVAVAMCNIGGVPVEEYPAPASNSILTAR